MGHKLEIVNGQARMAYVGDKPWHELGTEVLPGASVEQMMEAGNVNYIMGLRPLMAGRPGGNRPWDYSNPVPGHFALVRTSDGKVMDVVGDKYTIVQPREAFQFLADFVEAGQATMETIGSLDDGRMLWGLARLGADFAVAEGDTVRDYVLVGCPYTLGKTLVVKRVGTRVVCWNTFTAALREGGSAWRMIHRTKFDEVMRASARHALGLAREQIEVFHEQARTLASISMGVEDALKIIAGVIDPDFKGAYADLRKDGNRALNKVMTAYYTAPGASQDTAWGAFNAVTYYADHVAGRNPDSRLRSAWFGQTANVKQNVMQALLVGAGK